MNTDTELDFFAEYDRKQKDVVRKIGPDFPRQLEEKLKEATGKNYTVGRVTTQDGREAFSCLAEGEKNAAIVFKDELPDASFGRDLAEEAAGLVKSRSMGEVRLPETGEAFRKSLFVEVVNAKNNQSLLEHCVHDNMEDLGVVVRSRAERLKEEYMASCAVTPEMLSKYHMTSDEALDTAYRNTEVQGYTINKIRDVILGTAPNPETADDEDIFEYSMVDAQVPPDDVPLYVLTNKERVYGANEIVCSEAMSEAHDKLGDFYVLPSSIHEVILLPVDTGFKPEELQDIVKEINRTELKPSEVLSDNVYCYNGKKLSLVTGEAKEKKIENIRERKVSMRL